MKFHRFDPLSFVVGLATMVFGGILLWGDLDVPDVRPSHFWPLPVLALGLMLTLYGVRRLVESSPTNAVGAPDEGDEDEVEEGETQS
jgi:hypothetical protein